MLEEEGQAMVELCEVVKSYRAGEGEELVLRRVSISIAEGESVAVTGPSGSGKSTLLNIIGTLDQATSGKVTVAGEEVSGMNELALANFRNRRLGFVFQSHHLLPQCTVLENVLVPSLAFGDLAFRKRAAKRARKLLERVGLAHREGHRPAQLSGGECQRAAVVRALVNGPKLLLADEPTGALDRRSAEVLSDLLLKLNEEDGVTLIAVTHSSALAERMRRQLELRDGKLAEDGL